MKIIEDGNFTWSVSIFLVLVGFVVMFGFLKYGPPSVLSALMVCVGFGIAAVGGMTSRARMLRIKPFDNSYKKARDSYKTKDGDEDTK
ncbi:hypothetical protein QZM66_11835 [Burkholderia contaminans]|uniref:hypothetical protein n=1 Tax=Burkholderia TaxID=32008 RepID=UPI000B7A5D7D|nr:MULTISPECIES: hypothetical protein [Burkholderia]MDN7788242.1 hypothetical protein [Burkholderia contaminans]OXJ11240.1 hypothetical protein CFB45_30770 [Burkholderia sp. HI2500]